MTLEEALTYSTIAINGNVVVKLCPDLPEKPYLLSAHEEAGDPFLAIIGEEPTMQSLKERIIKPPIGNGQVDVNGWMPHSFLQGA